ncbi:MAG TPA: glycosyltransferase family 9 protein [Gammaproteobacteria bacterium]|nr:glycosyltransferase family 9 protein [Gammaproteobacteria bacterium]
MSARATALGEPREIAVFRALKLGDLLCVVPALRALRRALPRARVTLIGLPWARSFAARFGRYLDAFLPFPGWPGFPEQGCDAEAVPGFLAAAQARRFDLVLQLHGSGALSNPLVLLLGARRAAGYFRAGDYCPDPERFFPWRPHAHEVERYLELLSLLGVPANDPALEFPLSDADRAELAAAAKQFPLARRDYACVHPGAQLPSRRWPAERFAAVADALAADGLEIVLTGVAGEAELTRRVTRAMRAPALDLAGKTSLGGVAALIDGARLLVSNDTGVAHVAAARRTPSVRVSCGGDPHRWAPLDASLHRVLHHPVECRPCAYAICPKGHPCAHGVPVEQAVEAARVLLARAAPERLAG